MYYVFYLVNRQCILLLIVSTLQCVCVCVGLCVSRMDITLLCVLDTVCDNCT